MGNGDWENYAERMGQHLAANQIEDEKIKIAVLLCSVGANTFPDLPKTRHLKTF